MQAPRWAIRGGIWTCVYSTLIGATYEPKIHPELRRSREISMPQEWSFFVLEKGNLDRSHEALKSRCFGVLAGQAAPGDPRAAPRACNRHPAYPPPRQWLDFRTGEGWEESEKTGTI